MTKQPFRFSLFLLICSLISVTATAQTVDIPDSNLRAAIEAQLGKASGATITADEMATLTRLEAPEAGISNLTGLENLTNLTRLSLSHNSISDISALAGLTNLTRLKLDRNSISDISALGNLMNLTHLALYVNTISDPSPVARLTNLTSLNLAENSIADISALVNLTNLTHLELPFNSISDLSPLVANTGLGRGDEVDVRGNPLSNASIQTHIPALESRGVTVESDVLLPEEGFEPLLEELVDIPDANLRAAIEAKLGKASGAPITTVDMANLTDLAAPNANISNLTGLDHATNLTTLDLGAEYVEAEARSINSNSVSDLSPLAGLTNLTWLRLRNNSISDISPLAGLTNLEWLNLGGNLMISNISALSRLTNLTTLWLYGNSISDLSPLAGLTNLTSLTLWFNSISDISPLAGLTNLINLGLDNNLISDISPLTGLTNLTYLRLSNHPAFIPSTGLTRLTSININSNAISDLSPLVANTGLGTGDFVEVLRNPLSEASINTHIPALQNRGVEVDFIQMPTRLLKISGTVTASNNLLIVEVRDNRNRLLAGVSVTFTVISGGGTLSATSAMTGPDGRAESRLMLGPETGTNMVRASVEGVSESVTFSDVPELPVDIPDPNLRAAIEARLGKASGDPITASDMVKLTDLSARNANITDLTGLEAATNLTKLDLNSNSVSDISPVVGLTNLTTLWLHGNSISDISPVSGLTNLTDVDLTDNSISDISAVAGLTNLTWLLLRNNSISDISPVSGLTNLTGVGLTDNSISDISPVAGLTKLTTLWLDGNSISDLSPLVENMGLGDGDFVIVSENPLNYTSIHTHIPALQGRGVIVAFDNQAHPALLKISGDTQKGTSSAPLSQPFVVEVQDENGSVLAGISVTFAVITGGGTLSVTSTTTDANGRAQSILTLGPNLGTNTVEVSANGIQGRVIFRAISDTEPPPTPADVNGDGTVNIFDLVTIASQLGKQGQNLAADVNGDGLVDVQDLGLVAGMFDAAAAAPSAQIEPSEMLTAASVRGWLTDAKALEITDPIMRQGVIVLEQLLASLTPTETQLLPNYPNPFNPETWIPYRLANDAFVTLTIYDLNGQVVRTIDVGHQTASAYESRSQAIYWDGRNQLGEKVASGVYFYHLSAGDFSATRKMLILK